METLKIPRLVLDPASPMEKVRQELVEHGRPFAISNVQWATPRTVPTAKVWAGHRDQGLLLHFEVTEGELVALAGSDHGTVWMDSCVECFIQPPGALDYYNVEMNAIGSVLMACGPNRGRSLRLPLAALHTLRRLPSLGRDPIEPRVGPVTWSLTVDIPRSAFVRHPGAGFAGETWRGNFYKCGDGHQDPHWLTWNPIDVADGDFHRPEHFGRLEFER